MKTQHPDNPQVLNALGLSQMESKDYHAALATFEALQRVSPDSPQPLYLLGVARKALEQPKEARQYFGKALVIAEDHLAAQLALARLEAQEKNPAAALRIAQKIQQQRPDAAVGYRLEGDVLMQTGKPAAAAKVYENGLKKVESPRLVVALYAAQKKAGKVDPHTLLATWLKEHPEDLAVRAVYASALQEAGNLQSAVTQYQKLLAERPNDVVVLNNLAWSAQQLGRADAVGYAERAYKLAPETPAIADTLGWLLVSEGDVQRGLPLLEQAVAKAPHLAEIRYHLGVALYRVDQKSRAKAELKRALEMDDSFPGADEARNLLSKI